jgi:predicted ATPase
MITDISLQNFKCFDILQLPLRSLTILSGLNAAGKSSAVQGLMLLAQALRENIEATEIPLNGTYVQLGSPGDVLRNGGGSRNEIAIGFRYGNQSLEWRLTADDRTMGLGLRTTSIMMTEDGRAGTAFQSLGALIDTLGSIPIGVQTLRGAVVISANRQMIADAFPSPNGSIPSYGNVGLNGQYAPWWFHRLSDDEVDEARCHGSDSARTLRRQFAAWASTLFQGAQANAVPLLNTNLVSLGFRLGETDEWRRPTNTGYGLSYAFPILVAALIARKGQVLYVDSPEAHLHPAAQSAMGRFLARMAESGVQLIVETHSDHVLNGTRLAVCEKAIDRNNVVYQFFSRSTDGKTSSETVSVDGNGRMSAWPRGFFDQIEKDLAML